ncbi:MAG: acyltransferase family protein [Hyphomicrobiaceae bacterium]
MATQYRADIEGLRAVSVILVILFHLGLTGVPGGFVGVDVFFVISGYLISGILLRALQTGTFSLVGFYERRVRRIVPALLLIVAAVLAGGYLLLIPGDLKTAANSALHALLAISNFYFYFNTGYFDGTAEMAPLLHTWSLGVEEQFYFVWPLFLVLGYRLCGGRIGGLRALIVAAILISFTWNLYEITIHPTRAFYLPLARAWELAIGALLVLVPPFPAKAFRRWAAEALSLVGLGLIMWAGMMLSNKQPFPGLNAVYPVIGAGLLIYQSGTRTLVGQALSLPPMVFVGKLSYSLYLWHWPLIVFWRHYSNGAPLSSVERVAIVAAASFAAWISWRFVEMPFRYSKVGRGAIFGRAGLASLVAGALAGLVFWSGGIPQRLPVEQRSMGDKAVMWEWACPQEAEFSFPNFYNTDLPLKPCVLGAKWETAQIRGILWGDSNSQHLFPYLDVAARRENVAIAALYPCNAIVHDSIVRFDDAFNGRFINNCTAIRNSAVKYIKSHADISLIILASSWSNIPHRLYVNDSDQRSKARGLVLLKTGLEALLTEISAPNRRIVLFNDFPNLLAPGQTGDPVTCVLAASIFPRAGSCDLERAAWLNLTTVGQPIHDVLRSVAKATPNAYAHSPEDYICADGRCMTWLNGEFLYRDSNHIRRNLKAETVELFAEKLKLRQLLTGHSH